METAEAQTTLRQAQGERFGAIALPPFVLSPSTGSGQALSKHERRLYPQMIEETYSGSLIGFVIDRVFHLVKIL